MKLCVILAALSVLATQIVQIQAADKVELGFYSEALCPYCIQFADEHLSKAIEEVGDIFTLKYVPWGNAEYDPNTGTITCQHGEVECHMNTIEACALYYYPTRDTFWPFLHCIDISQSPDESVAENCAQQLSYNWTAINTCAKGNMGYKLDIMYYQETNALNPPHKYTPWVTINGEHETKAEGSGVIEVICKAYTGTDKPNACEKFR